MTRPSPLARAVLRSALELAARPHQRAVAARRRAIEHGYVRPPSVRRREIDEPTGADGRGRRRGRCWPPSNATCATATPSTTRCITASSGDQALDLLRRLRLREDTVALLLVDQRMPGMSGTEFLAASRELYPDAKRVLLTAYADTDAAIRAINDADVHHYLLKPWDPPEERLYPVLDDLLETWRRPAPAANLRVVGDRWSAASHALREFLARNLVPYRWLDVETDPQARLLLDAARADAGTLPVAGHRRRRGARRPRPAPRSPSGSGCRCAPSGRPTTWSSSARGRPGWRPGCTAPRRGCPRWCWSATPPAGRPARPAGSRTTWASRSGSPAPTSRCAPASRPSGSAPRSWCPAEVAGLRREDPYTVIRLADGSEISASTLLIASGVNYRTLDVPGAADAHRHGRLLRRRPGRGRRPRRRPRLRRRRRQLRRAGRRLPVPVRRVGDAADPRRPT